MVVRYLILPYALMRVVRSWRLFAALLLGVVLASMFFAGINIGADTAAKQALDQQLSQVPVDIVVRSMGLLSSANATKIADDVSGIDGVIGTEVISRAPCYFQPPGGDDIMDCRFVGISNNSRVYEGWMGGVSTIEENETYVWVGSQDAERLETGDILQLNFSIPTDINYRVSEPMVKLTLNLTVAGFVQLDDHALSIATGQYYSYSIPSFAPGIVVSVVQQYLFEPNLLILSWEKTFTRFLDYIYALSSSHNPIDTEILVYLDREALISPWDIGGSINNLDTVTTQVDYAVSTYGMSATNNLVAILNMHQFMVILMRFSFVANALPVFFVAWYMGMTVSGVSFNLRRREIGLLLTKGFSRGQLLRMFWTEAFLTGFLAGIVGVILSFALNPFFIRAFGGEFTGALAIGPETIVLTVAFSVIITFLSTFQPARKASKLNPVDALREYAPEQKVERLTEKKLPWIAFIAGSYKIVILLLGVNLTAEMMRVGSSNIIVFILLGIAVSLDGMLTYIGPLLFFWGFTRIFIRASLKFQELTAKAARFLGDLGALATRNVQRNPARAASIAFLIALIIGYSFQVTGTLASEQDYIVREIYSNVGADVSVSLSSTTDASALMNNIANLPEVVSTALEHSVLVQSSFEEYMSLRAVNPERWLATAYYESGWFTGTDVETAFQSLASDDNTIILERSVAKELDLDIGYTITLFQRDLRIVGFFGIEPPEIGIPGAPSPPGTFGILYWSYVPEGLYPEFSGAPSVSTRILVKLEDDADGQNVANEIRNFDLNNISSVDSVAERLEEWESNALLSGSMNIQRLGVVFAVLAASIGTALVTLVSLKERSREASLMSVRGLSFKQLVVMLLTENLAVVAFSVLLGAVVGLIIVRGNVAAANAFAFSLVSRRVVFPTYSLLTLLSCFSLVFASTILPVIMVARKYVSKLERMVQIG